MLRNLQPQAPDKIIGLIGMYAADPRADKLDLGVGVYKDAGGKTPVMAAVKAAEEKLWRTQPTKSYIGLLGDLSFIDAMRELVLGDAVPATRVTGAQTPGGTGAVRQLTELIRMADPKATVWMSDPTWPNHPAILKYVGLKTSTYRYFDAATRGVDFAAMLDDLGRARAGDVVLLHGCCHNPTGANLSASEWNALTDLVLAKGLIPFIDIAYQGFGDGLAEDAAGLRAMAARVPQMMIAASCSKNFGLYRERVGVALVLGADAGAVDLARGALTTLNRLNYSFPPDHGARVVEMILRDKDLRASWQGELEGMRARMLELRMGLADALKRASNSDRFEFIRTHRGMFSRLGMTPEQVDRLRNEKGVYMVGDSRINVAGLREDGLEDFARAIIEVSA